MISATICLKECQIENKGNKESFIATKTLITIDAYSRAHAGYRNTPSEVSSKVEAQAKLGLFCNRTEMLFEDARESRIV